MQASDPISIYIIDDHDIVRFGLEGLIRSDRRFVVLGSASSLEEGLSQISRLKPHVVVTDLTLGDSNGLETLSRVIAAQHPGGVLVVSMHDELIYGAQVVRLGARGYIMKDRAHSETLNALHAVAGGGVWTSPAVSAQLIGQARPASRSVASARAEGSAPSPREIQVLELMKRGLTSKEIAFELGLSVRTVDMHRANLKLKLGARSAAELMSHAIRRL